MKVYLLDGKLVHIGDAEEVGEGWVESDEELFELPDGSLCLDSDYVLKRSLEYPNIKEQLDHIYHNGIESWKNNVINPIKLKHPKP